MRRSSTSSRPLVLSLFSLLLASACGGGDSSGESETTAAGGSSAGQGGKGGQGGLSGASGQSGQAGSAGSSAGKAGAAGSGAGAAGKAGSDAGGNAGSAGASGSAGSAGSQAGGASGKAGSDAGGNAGSEAGGSAGSQAGGSAGSDAGGAAGDATAGGAAGSDAGGAAGSSGSAGCETGELCDGVCLDTSSDPAHCGSCSTACSSFHGSAACVSSVCTIACDDGFADCDGKVGNGCETTGACACVPGEVSDCYAGPAGTQDVGPCKAGTRTCDPTGTGYGECVGQVLPATESCLTAVDDDCNGQVNESGEGCACAPGSQSPCYGGPDGTQGVGPCQGGTQTCKADGTGYGECVGQVLPVVESCLTPLVDDDCNGQLNESGEGCACVPGAKKNCYEGPPGTSGFGLCKGGQRTCQADGTGFGACEGQVVPAAEVCDGTLNDEDCDGETNEGGAGCACLPADIGTCYTGPAGTQNVGLCKAGYQICNEQGTAYGACTDQVTPLAEVCDGTINDENCNGQTNEGGAGCVCQPNQATGCYSGPGGTQGVGVCKGGTHTCNEQGTGYGACLGEVVPQAKDFCSNSVDDDCNGQVLTCTGNQACNPQTGDCVDACDPVLLGTSYIGCVYYPTVTPNSPLAGGFNFAVAVSNTNAQPVTVTVTRGATQAAQVTVAANSVQIIKLPWVNELKNLTTGSLKVTDGAYRLVSTRPVTVYQYNPLEYSNGGTFSYTNDASLLLPVNTWRNSYMVASRALWQFNGGIYYSGFYAVVASQDGTTVTLAKGVSTLSVKGGVAGVDAVGNGTITLNEGDVAVLTTGGTNLANDLTGSLVTSDKPVQVIGGHDCTFVPANIGYCDHLEESMFPTETLAKEYLVAAPLIPNGNVPKANMVRLVALEANTTFTYDPPQAGAPTSVASAGGWVEFQTAQSFKITGSKRFMAVQYALGQDAGGNSGDPDMALVVATAQYRNDYLFHAPTNYEKNFTTIMAVTGTGVTLDGVAVPAASFTAIGGTGYSVARVQLSNAGNGNHTVVSAQPSGVSVYGYGQYTSYWYPGGLDLKPIQN